MWIVGYEHLVFNEYHDKSVDIRWGTFITEVLSGKDLCSESPILFRLNHVSECHCAHTTSKA